MKPQSCLLKGVVQTNLSKKFKAEKSSILSPKVQSLAKSTRLYSTSALDMVPNNGHQNENLGFFSNFYLPISLPETGRNPILEHEKVSKNAHKIKWDVLYSIKICSYRSEPDLFWNKLLKEQEHQPNSTNENASTISTNSSLDGEEEILNEIKEDLENQFKDSNYEHSSSFWDIEMNSGFMDPVPYAQEIFTFISNFYSFLRSSNVPYTYVLQSKSQNQATHISEQLKSFSNSYLQQLTNLAKSMNVEQMIIPFLELDLPSETILQINSNKHSFDSNIHSNHPSSSNQSLQSNIEPLSYLFDLFDTDRRTLAYFIFSSSDGVLVILPCIQLHPYPLCWLCNQNFGVKSCAQCRIARYCSKQCQISNWEIHHNNCLNLKGKSSLIPKPIIIYGPDLEL